MAVGRAAIALLALFAFDGTSRARAEGAPLPRVVHAIDRYPYVLWRETWGGGDMLARSWSLYSGATFAMTGDIEGDGWRLRSVGGYGRYSYQKWARGVDGPELRKHTGHKTFSDVLGGYQTRWGDLTLKAFAGFNGEQHIIDPRDATNDAAGSAYGGKVLLEAWLQVSRRHWVAGDVSYATTFDTYKVGLRTGYQLTDMLDVGVEGRLEGNDAYKAERVGGFATLRFDDAGLTAAAGVAGDRDRRSSPYATLNVFFRY